jgi:hypothetical protein
MGLRDGRDMVAKRRISGIAGNQTLIPQPLASHSTGPLQGPYSYTVLRIFIGSLRASVSVLSLPISFDAKMTFTLKMKAIVASESSWYLCTRLH